jgi:WD40 repeat protein
LVFIPQIQTELAIAVSPDGKTVVSGYYDGTIRLWDISSGKELRTITGHKGWIIKVAFTPDGKIIVSGSGDATVGSGDATVKLWDTSTGKEIRTISYPDMTGQMALSPDGRSLAVIVDKGYSVKLLDLSAGTELPTLTGWTSSAVNNLTFSPNGKTLATCRLQNKYLVQPGELQGTNLLDIWNVSTGKELGRANIMQPHSIAFSPDGKMLAAASGDSSVYVWDLSLDIVRRPLKGHESIVWAVAFSPDGNMLASGGGVDDIGTYTILWDANSRSEIRRLKGHTLPVIRLAFTPDGKMLLSGSADGTIKVWAMPDGTLLRTLAGPSPKSGLIIP